ncbi:AGAP008098-PA-like protein [Anopheles sinensis]|uniref:AGAP008098-PA-like protein n=1 Tax=Anopheles sinensis TaxID=74873 RepID=A0A084WGX9_ANOSI|nr:AGAP008098-PA-like protein [Anopheles sinensis]
MFVASIEQTQQQQPSKKFSKTPGRERKPTQAKKGTNGKGGTSGAQQYKGTALQFNSLGGQQHKSTTLGTILQNASVPVSSGAGGGSVWGENCARFSDVVAQMSSTKSGQQQQQQSGTASSPLLGMEFLLGLPLNANAPPSGSTPKPKDATRKQCKSKDDSYLVGAEERESSAPFVATSASPDLGPIGTSKKSPTGSNNGVSGCDAEETDGFGGRTNEDRAALASGCVAKSWEPFGGHVLHNPGQLASATTESNRDEIGQRNHHQSDSFFSQSFADFHHRTNDQFRGISSMAGGAQFRRVCVSGSHAQRWSGHGQQLYRWWFPGTLDASAATDG